MNDLTEGELLALPFLFEFWAMEHQLPPDGDWRSWVIMGGRGAGKTRAGAEWVRSQVEGAMPLDEGRAKRVALVGETIEQVREVMIFGDSGILACSPPDRKPAWEAGRKRLVWPNGAIATVHSAFDPEGLRGPQFDAVWVDEMGCSAVDKGTNEPNKFVDAKSSESSLPRYSNGARDDFIQAQYLKAVISFWNDPQENPVSPEYEAPMVNMDRAFVWAWDARPYPYFPNNEALWSDARNYARGHWLNGRSSSRSLASVVTEICSKSGLSAIDTSGLYGQVRGFTVSDVADARSALQPLMLRYSFDAIERDGLLVFRMRNGSGAVDVNADHLALSTELEGVVEQTRDPEASIAGRVRLRFMQADASFDVLSEEAVLADEQTHSVSTTEVPIALTRTEGRQVAERWLSEARMARDRVRIALPPSQLGLGAGDIIRLAGEQNEGQGTYRIDRLEQGMLQIADAVRIDGSVYVASDLEDEVVSPPLFVPPAPVYAQFLDLPLMTGNEEPHAPFFAASAQPWPGSVALYQSSSDSDFRLLDTFAGRAIIGFTQDRLLEAPSGRLDRGPALRVKLMSGALSSVDEQAFLSGANLAAIGNGTADDWEIFQFQKATLVEPDTYDLSLRLRGQFGTDALSPNEWPSGSVFVLLNGVPEQISLLRNSLRVAQTYRIGPAKRPVADPSYTQSVEAFAGNGLRPYSPVHLSPVTHSDGGLELSWIRRTRIDGDGWDGLEVPLGEEAESYFVRVRKAGTIIREETVSQSNWIYPLSAQATDGATGECTLEVAQISATFGPGPFARLIVTL